MLVGVVPAKEFSDEVAATDDGGRIGRTLRNQVVVARVKVVGIVSVENAGCWGVEVCLVQRVSCLLQPNDVGALKPKNAQALFQ